MQTTYFRELETKKKPTLIKLLYCVNKPQTAFLRVAHACVSFSFGTWKQTFESTVIVFQVVAFLVNWILKNDNFRDIMFLFRDCLVKLLKTLVYISMFGVLEN